MSVDNQRFVPRPNFLHNPCNLSTIVAHLTIANVVMDGTMKRKDFWSVKNDIDGRLMDEIGRRGWRRRTRIVPCAFVVGGAEAVLFILLGRRRRDDGEGGGADVRSAFFEMIKSDAG